jgi:leucine dehydrogenase
VSATTALGVIEAMRACAEQAWGSPDLAGRRVAVQGLGAVGGKVVAALAQAGAQLVVTDLDPERDARVVDTHSATAVVPDEIYGQAVDVFCLCAVGGIVNDATLPQLKAKVIAGGANNVLAEDRHCEELERRGVVYAVDFIANSGGVVCDTDRFRRGGLQPERAAAGVRRIFDRVREVFELADRDGVSCQRAAQRLAERRIAAMAELRLLDYDSAA